MQDDDIEIDKWDCQSILSTYSNLYNHPKVIATKQIRLSKKTGLPLVEKTKKEQPVKSESDDDDDEEEEDDDTKNSQSTMVFERKKGETSEERRARKHAIKEMRRDRRMIKKATKVLFKQEEQKQLHEQALHSTQAHLQSLRVT